MVRHNAQPKSAPRAAVEDAPPVTLRLLRETDLDRVIEIESSCFESHWTREAIQCEMGNACTFYVVATSAGKTVGYAGEWIIMDEAHITTIAVDPRRHGQRFGERLLVALLQEARYRGARRATLEVRITNFPALRLYEKYGFETVAIRKKYYQDTGEDALVMWMNDLFDPKMNNLLSQRFGPRAEMDA
jgi:ribosomal-protein-alanine N-acetyltransferase